MKYQTNNEDLGLTVSAKPRGNHKAMNMKKLWNDQRGFSLIELLVVIVLTSLITTAITTTFFQIFDMNTRTANHMSAVSQVQQAGKMVRQDVLQAQNVSIDVYYPYLLELTWTVWATGDEHKVIYTFEDMPSGEFKILWREHYVKEGVDFELDSTTKVAEYINTDQTNCVAQPEGAAPEAVEVLIFTVTATVGEESETREYRVQPRPGT